MEVDLTDRITETGRDITFPGKVLIHRADEDLDRSFNKIQQAEGGMGGRER